MLEMETRSWSTCLTQLRNLKIATWIKDLKLEIFFSSTDRNLEEKKSSKDLHVQCSMSTGSIKAPWHQSY